MISENGSDKTLGRLAKKTHDKTPEDPNKTPTARRTFEKAPKPQDLTNLLHSPAPKEDDLINPLVDPIPQVDLKTEDVVKESLLASEEPKERRSRLTAPVLMGKEMRILG